MKGTKVYLGESRGWNQILLEVIVINKDTKPIQITAIIVEEESTEKITHIIPDKFPIVLDPSTMITVDIQKEGLDEDPMINHKTKEGFKTDVWKIKSFGVIDALEEKYLIGNNELQRLVRECNELPSNKALYRNKNNPEEAISAFQVKDKFKLLSREDE